MSVLSDILRAATPIAYDLTEGATIVLHSGAGASFDPEDLDVGVGTGASCSVPCSAPWPYKAEGLGVASGMLQVALNGQAPELTLVPEAGMLATIDGRTYTIAEAQHALDSEEWVLVLKGAG